VVPTPTPPPPAQVITDKDFDIAPVVPTNIKDIITEAKTKEDEVKMAQRRAANSMYR
jgi:hypothetical protein